MVGPLYIETDIISIIKSRLNLKQTYKKNKTQFKTRISQRQRQTSSPPLWSLQVVLFL